MFALSRVFSDCLRILELRLSQGPWPAMNFISVCNHNLDLVHFVCCFEHLASSPPPPLSTTVYASLLSVSQKEKKMKLAIFFATAEAALVNYELCNENLWEQAKGINLLRKVR